MTAKKVLIVLDRDGVINHDSDYYIKSPDEWIPIAGSLEAIAQLTRAGYQIVIATNQSGVNRGLYSLDILNAIHQKMRTAIESCGGKIEKIYFCPHRPDENCECRKPQPGMLRDIQRDFKVNNDEMIYVGDSSKDYEAANIIGCPFFLVKTGNGLKTVLELKNKPVSVFDDLRAFVTYFLNQSHS